MGRTVQGHSQPIPRVVRGWHSVDRVVLPAYPHPLNLKFKTVPDQREDRTTHQSVPRKSGGNCTRMWFTGTRRRDQQPPSSLTSPQAAVSGAAAEPHHHNGPAKSPWVHPGKAPVTRKVSSKTPAAGSQYRPFQREFQCGETEF